MGMASLFADNMFIRPSEEQIQSLNRMDNFMRTKLCVAIAAEDGTRQI